MVMDAFGPTRLASYANQRTHYYECTVFSLTILQSVDSGRLYSLGDSLIGIFNYCLKSGLASLSPISLRIYTTPAYDARGITTP